MIQSSDSIRSEMRLAVAAALTSAVFWGLIWYPFRVLAAWGIGGAEASFAAYAVALLVALLVFRRSFVATPSWGLLALGISAGLTNVGFVWATIHGDVLRVVLLFYTLPVWTVIFARVFLGEKIGGAALVVSAAALAGAVTMLWDPSSGWPLPRDAAEWVGLGAGIGFALSNVLYRVTMGERAATRLVYVLAGCVLVGILGAFSDARPVHVLAADLPWALSMLALLGALLVLINLVAQYGIERLPANRVPVIFLSELIVTAGSSWLLVNERLGAKEIAGAVLIATAGLLSARTHASA